MIETKILLSIPDAAARLSIGRSKLYQLLMAGDLRSVRIGRAVRVPVEEVDRFARRLLVEAEAEA